MINKYFKVKAPEIDDLRGISNLVLNKVPNPLDKYEIAAALESFGWNDNMAKEKFGQENIFSLSESIWDFVQKDLDDLPAEQYENKISFRDYLGYSESINLGAHKKTYDAAFATGLGANRVFFIKSARSFLRGIVFAMPVAISVVAILTLRFSLWLNKGYSQSMAISLSLWTLISFIVVGGFTQALARRSLTYPDDNPLYTARKTAYYFARLGLIFSLGIAVYFSLLNWLFPIYPSASLIILYFFFLSVLWLSVTIMYMLKKELIITELFAAGIALVLVLTLIFKIDIVISQLIAFCGLAIAGYFISKYYYLQSEEKMGKGVALSLPQPSFRLFSTLPYFVYGFFYFVFLTVDRVMAWSAHSGPLPYLFSFRGEYEFGLDFAIFALILPLGLAEVLAGDLMLKLHYDQKNYSIKEMSLMNRLYKSFYQKRVYLMSLFCLLNGIILYFVLTFLNDIKIIPLNVLGTPVAHFVLVIAIISYSILSLGLLNSLILFSHSQPRMAGFAFAVASLVNLGAGFILGRWVDYSWAVFGLLGGSLIFWLMTTRQVLKVLTDLQYNLYLGQ